MSSIIHDKALYDPGATIGPDTRVWATQYKFSTDAVLAVLASDAYDDRDHIRDYQAYLAFKAT